ncbi:MAG: F0F1 ATP synthase subunit B [Rhodocyclales bacterium]|nr:F0F1 ATP synthase subunit B [Rhodocyclales bacterium]
MNINLTLLAQAAAFAIFIWFTARFVWPYLSTAIDERQKTIADGLAHAERAKHELELAGKRSADTIREAKDRYAEIVAQAEKRAQQIIDEAKEAAKAEGARIVAGAKAEIDQEVMRAKETLRERVADLAVAGATKILRREVDAKAHADVLGQLRQEL